MLLYEYRLLQNSSVIPVKTGISNIWKKISACAEMTKINYHSISILFFNYIKIHYK